MLPYLSIVISTSWGGRRLVEEEEEEEGEVQGEENGEAINPTLLWTFSPRPAPLARWSDGAQAQASLSAVSESSSPSNKSCKTATSFLNLRLA
jgi:hypothetical protein